MNALFRLSGNSAGHGPDPIKQKTTFPADSPETLYLRVIFLPEERERKEGNQEYFPFFLSSGIPEEKGGGIPSLFPSFPLFLPTFLPDG